DFRIHAGAAISSLGNVLEERDGTRDGQIYHIADAGTIHQDRQTLRPQPLAAAGLAELLHHVLFERFPHSIAAGLAVTALDIAQHPFPLALEVAAFATVPREAEATRRPVQDRTSGILAQLSPGSGKIELEGPGQRRQYHFPEVAARLAPRQNDTLENRNARIADNQLGVHLPPSADTVT